MQNALPALSGCSFASNIPPFSGPATHRGGSCAWASATVRQQHFLVISFALGGNVYRDGADPINGPRSRAGQSTSFRPVIIDGGSAMVRHRQDPMAVEPSQSEAPSAAP